MLEARIREGFESTRADELRRINEAIQETKDKLDHLIRRRAEVLGVVEDVFCNSPVAEQPGIELIEKLVA